MKFKKIIVFPQSYKTNTPTARQPRLLEVFFFTNIHKELAEKHRDCEGPEIFLRDQSVFCMFKSFVFIFPRGFFKNTVLIHKNGQGFVIAKS